MSAKYMICNRKYTFPALNGLRLSLSTFVCCRRTEIQGHVICDCAA